ncbi:MAG: 16S rRNA (cytidine(1402)-2'-O)-methyltransferase [Oscillospiraceae bacterium]|nr:16S rRNA (cytidine(1402)-2'-O)-methyltransferase [Oscillospiraceae bacterium]
MPTLYIVPTPIGNLGDLSDRAKQTLREVGFIAAEDTRVSVKLLNHLGIKKPLVSYYEHNKRESGQNITIRIMSGESCALVTDAGTPGISDPGADLVAMCETLGIPVVALPGPCAAVTALSVSGVPGGRFCFEGYLSMNKKNRRTHLDALRREPRVMVFYEAPHKLPATLSDLLSALGDRRVVICREMTKLHEEILRTTLSEASAHFSRNTPRGEFVLVVAGADPDATPDPDPDQSDGNAFEEAVSQASAFIAQGDTVRDAVRKAAQCTGARRVDVYAAITKMINAETYNAET